MFEYDPLKRDTIGSMRILTCLLSLAPGLLMAQQPQTVSTWPPLASKPGVVYSTPNGPLALIEPVVMGPGILPPVKGPFGWFISSANIPAAVSAGWIPMVLAATQPTDGTERWCISGDPNLDMTIDGVMVTRTINPAAVKEVVLTTTAPPISSAGSYESYHYSVVPPGPVRDGSGAEIRITPWWSRSDAACQVLNPSVTLSAFPITPGTTYKRTAVLVLANW